MSNTPQVVHEAKADSVYWDNLLVNHEKISEIYLDTQKAEAAKSAFIAYLSPTDKEGLQSILKLSDFKEEQKWTQNLKDSPEFLNLLFLKEFLKRKKKAVEEVFRCKVPDYATPSISPLTKLIHLFYTNPDWLLEVFVLNEWRNKISGDIYIAGKDFPDIRSKLSRDSVFQQQLINILYRNSGQSSEYRTVAHCDIDKKHSIYLLYKLIKDSKRPGYDENKRIKDRDQILFSLDNSKHTLEIKASSSDAIGVKKYFDEQFNTILRKMESSVFSNYNAEDIIQLFREGTPVGDEEPDDFSIESITFSNSLLIKSPDVILQLKGSDIWPSVNDAFNRGIVDLYSLKDIKKIGFRSEKHSKSIRSIVLEDGNVFFKLNDSNLDGSTKNSIKEKFLNKFGFPLDQPVRNKFDGGEAFKVDQIFRFASTDPFTHEHKKIYEELNAHQLIIVNEETSFHCSNPTCSFITIDRAGVKVLSVDDERQQLICPECDESINQFTNEELVPKGKNIENFINQLINTFVNHHQSCDNPTTSTQTFKKNKYTFKRFFYKDEPYQILVTDSLLPKKTLEWIERKLIPTIIICYGIDKQTSDRYAIETVEQITFGDIYVQNKSGQFFNLMETYLKDLEKRTHHIVVTAAMKATKNLTYIGDKTSTLENIYDENMLEDDAFTIIKHLFPNSEKWGKEYTGHPVPEGIFAIQYKENSGSVSTEIKHAFTYDCKFTLEKSGYKLGSSENRKSLHYINQLNRLVNISTYCTSREVTSHIFIGNKFRERQARAMAEFIREEIVKGHHTKPVFINSKDLAYLYDQFIANKDKIDKTPDIFYKQIAAIFTTDDVIITKEYIDEQLEDIEIAAESYSILNTTKLTKKLIRKKK
ncbi:hypothetical protein HPL003_26795 [Paenibacillus terrae HPL-003]|uniref:Uncharacterized protein n=1 Tax=Paenibacillus terrae (strain HPL-003) TaxID=985665 RepID=G7VRQ2_PAETH|nr:hypothetical protein [Paenibacillus terrae]AET62071.1 hypothetical protein HPL003_26795 [Paenibacillus terrae HPL-003]